jgi:hypothetical protein
MTPRETLLKWISPKMSLVPQYVTIMTRNHCLNRVSDMVGCAGDLLYCQDEVLMVVKKLE